MARPKPTGLLGTSHCSLSFFKLTKCSKYFYNCLLGTQKWGLHLFSVAAQLQTARQPLFPMQRPCSFQLFWVTSKNRQKKSNENIPFHVWLHSLECCSTPTKARTNTLDQQAPAGLSKAKLYRWWAADICQSRTFYYLKKVGRNFATNFTTSKIKMY